MDFSILVSLANKEMALANRVTAVSNKVMVSADAVLAFIKNTVTALTNTVNGFCECTSIFVVRKEGGVFRTSSATVTSQRGSRSMELTSKAI